MMDVFLFFSYTINERTSGEGDSNRTKSDGRLKLIGSLSISVNGLNCLLSWNDMEYFFTLEEPLIYPHFVQKNNS